MEDPRKQRSLYPYISRTNQLVSVPCAKSTFSIKETVNVLVTLKSFKPRSVLVSLQIALILGKGGMSRIMLMLVPE
jgi:hypothetical protein